MLVKLSEKKLIEKLPIIEMHVYNKKVITKDISNKFLAKRNANNKTCWLSFSTKKCD